MSTYKIGNTRHNGGRAYSQLLVQMQNQIQLDAAAPRRQMKSDVAVIQASFIAAAPVLGRKELRERILASIPARAAAARRAEARALEERAWAETKAALFPPVVIRKPERLESTDDLAIAKASKRRRSVTIRSLRTVREAKKSVRPITIRGQRAAQKAQKLEPYKLASD